nr:hypothetical protein HK105_003316 [Polyrhizophydium stewartii]
MMASAGSKLKHQISSGLATSAAKKDSESDDGDDDDEDEDEDESGDDEEGEDDVLNFYGLDTLFPTKWTEIPAAGMAFAPKGSRASSQPSTPSKARLGMDDAVCAVDASDPLGIRETIFRRGKRRDSRMGLGGGSGPSVLIQEKNFDATFFLREIHKQTSHKDLEQGAVRLKVSIEQRDEVIKGLVKKYFAKFVSAKSTIDSFYREMRQKNLISLPDYGIAPFEKALENLETNANKLYGPVLGRRSNGDKIRIALSILEGWKFFFNLPSSLTDQIKKGKYDGAVRDFKKGKYLMQSSFTDESGSAKETRQDMRSGKDAAAGLLPKTHKAVFDKVWAEVDKIVGQLRDELFSKLGDPSQSVEAQEKLIGYLVDLDADKNPVRCFLERQYMWLVDQLPNATASATQSKRADELSMYEVKRGLSCVTSRNFELFFREDTSAIRNNDDAQAWKLTLRFIQELCSLLCSRLPDLCRVCKVYVDGKLGKSRTAENGRKAGQSRRAERVERMIRNITNLVRLILTDTFGLTMPFASILETFGPNDRGAQSAFSATTFTESLYPEYKEGTSVNTTENDDDFDARLVQPDISDIPALQARLALLVAHPLILAHYSTKVISVLGHMFSEIHSVAFLYEDALIRGMARSVTQVQLRLVESICEGLQSTSAAFYLFEDWSYEANSTVPGKISGSAMADCTAMVKLFYRFTKFIVRTLAYIHSVPVIAFVSEDSQTTPQSAASTMRDGQGQTHGRASLQAMRQQASDRIRAALLESQYLFLDGLQHLAVNYIVAREPTGFGELASSVIHDRWMGGLGGQGFKLGCALAFGDSQISKAHTKKLDIQSPDTRCFIILGNLAFQKSVAIPKFFNMLEAKSHALLSADIQVGPAFAQPLEVSKLLVRRIMTEMLYSLANHMLMAYRAVDCFSTGGMLQCRQSTLEAEFMHHTLKAYETTQTADIFSMVYDTIERSTVRAESQTQTSINEALIRVKGFLQGAKKSTGSIMTGITYNKPEDPLVFMEECIGKIRSNDLLAPRAKLRWDTFLPPIPKGQGGLKRDTIVVRKKLTQILNSTYAVSFNAKPGGPGCGKGTQCARIARDYHYTHLSAGDLLRAEVATGSELGRQLNAMMKEGKIVPMEITLRLLCDAMEASSSDAEGFLIDGFPRQLDQAIAFEEHVAKCKFVLYFECSEAVLEKRLIERGKMSGRADDNIETIKKRFKTFIDTSYAVIESFMARGKCIKISSEPSPDEVYQEVQKHFGDHPLYHPNIVFVLGGPGSGKGTQCERLAKEFKLTHLSTGDLLRAEVDKMTEIGKMASGLMKEGKIVPMVRLADQVDDACAQTEAGLVQDMILSLLRAEIERNITSTGFLIVLAFQCSLKVLEERLIERGKTSGRADDNIETIRKRFNTFAEQSMPVIEYYKKKGKCVEISSERPIDMVYAESRQIFIPPKPLHHPNLIFVLGTQCERIARAFNLTHISTGDLLRREVQNQTPVGLAVAKCMQEGVMAPSGNLKHYLLDLLTREIMINFAAPGFLIDGFPRAMDQALEFERVVGKPRSVLFFHCPLEVLEVRLVERGKTSGRADDNIETIRKRFTTYQNESMPVIRYYEEKKLVISSIPTPDQVFDMVQGHFKYMTEPLPFDGERIVFVLGGPGSGKGTQCDRLVEKLQFAHLSTGDLLRDEVKKGTPLGAKLEADMKEGKMVPVEITMELLRNAMETKRGCPGFLIDGFPRTIEQAHLFESMIGRCSFVLYFEASNEVLTARLLKRGETSGRADDNIESIKKRLVTFEQASMPVITYYDRTGRVRKINSEGHVDEVTAATLQCFEVPQA